MKREIGSIFSVSDIEIESNEFNYDDIGYHFFSLCREALLCIANNFKERKVILIPAYTCQTVIEPFLQENWEVHFYPIDKKLCIKQDEFLSLLERVSPRAVLIHTYYGKKLSESEINLLKQTKKRGILVINDLTQSVFSQKNQEYVDITVGSIRKWMGIPDGAFISVRDNTLIEIPEIEQYNTDFTIPQLDAMYLRKEYFRTNNSNYKKISIRLNKYAEGLTTKRAIVLHKASNFSLNLLKKTDLDEIKKRRIENFKILLSTIKKNEKCITVISSLDELDNAPLYFPVYVKEREQFQKNLAYEGIYAPILWNIENNNVLIDDTVRYIYDHLLAIPIDQRYDCDDMLRIADIINAICNSNEL